jgi:prepilin-type N-terminal cleavage/methylation domain-containing protein
VIGRNIRRRPAAFSLVEILVAMAVFGFFAGGLLTAWSFLGTTALNTTAYAQRQNDHMRIRVASWLTN